MPGSQTTAAEGTAVLRGSPNRRTNFMEKLQLGYINAVAAAAGCILQTPEVDDGVDIVARHTSDAHTALIDKTARLEIQLKATSSFVDDDGESVSVRMRRDRWEYYRSQDVTLGKIVVIMSIPKAQEQWTRANHDYFAIRHCAYWVNLSTLQDSAAATPLVSASRDNIFDDVALCRIMERIGQGGVP